MECTPENLANAIRILTVDAVKTANSGHPGLPLGMADAITVLFQNFLVFDAENSEWINRDRFILSAGHGSMLLYAVLYLTGYKDFPLEEIKNFRTLHSRTTGHPEYGLGLGIENTSGPLGQGLANAVGIAIAERILNSTTSLIEHHTYVVVGDGCLMEGISHEAASLAGHLKLNKLIVLFDDNGISIDGKTSLTLSEDPLERFASYGWNTLRINGHNFEEIYISLKSAKNSELPTIIACKTVIGKYLSNREGTENAHSGPLNVDEIRQFKDVIKWPQGDFVIPVEIFNTWRTFSKKTQYENWQENFNKLPSNLKLELDRRVNNQTATIMFSSLNDLKEHLLNLKPKEATRQTFGRVVNLMAEYMPEIVGGSADLTKSNNTKSETMSIISKENYNGNYIHYGVREHAMAAIMNGLALHKGILPYGGTFLIFSDYCRPALRLSALMQLPVIYIMTHDSIAVGEDGPTHQPIEHLFTLRSIPNLYVFRPADAVETLECCELILKLKKSPSLLALTRQTVNCIPRTLNTSLENLSSKGGYIIKEAQNSFKVTLMSTGSEVQLAYEAANILENQNIGVRVISIPCMRLLDLQPLDYLNTLLNNETLKVAVEAGVKWGWERYIGKEGIFIGIDEFGLSAPYNMLYEHFKLSPEQIAKKCLENL